MVPKTEYAPYFERYMQLSVLKDKTIIESLESAQDEFDSVLRNLPDKKHSFSYATGKWTLKELIQHVIDTERVFCYRALSFARNDQTALPGFDQDVFVDNDTANEEIIMIY